MTIGGEVAESSDVVAIYVGSELRGKQEVIINGGVAWVNAQVNAAGGNETISFKIYDASAAVTYENSDTSAVITPGGNIGNFASPLMIEMKDSNGDPVVDTTAPVITVMSGTDTVEQGSTWTDAGATSDTGEIVTASGTVNTSASGTYIITYSATDIAGNTGTATRTVTVIASGVGESFGNVEVYANNSATIIGQVTIEGEVAEIGDVLAIYVGSELRGKQEVIINGGLAWVNALVNAAGGDETIRFKVYDASAGVTYENSNTSTVITPGGIIGNYDSPLMIEMKNPKEGDPNNGNLVFEPGANLAGAELSNMDISDKNLQGANLQGANLIGANLSNVNLEGANLSNANLEGANLTGANIQGTQLLTLIHI